MTFAEIVTIGNELLTGRVVNTNAAYLAKELTKLGFSVRRVVVVPDEIAEMVREIKDSLKRASVVIITGGLGPTFDDKTSEALAIALGRELVINEEALKALKAFYESRGMELTECRVKMAKMPKGAIPLINPVGSAPGIKIRIGEKAIFALPGVPREMTVLFETRVKPILKRMSDMAFAEVEMTVEGLVESEMASLIEETMNAVKGVYIKSMAGMGRLAIVIYSYGSCREEITEKVKRARDLLVQGLTRLGGQVSIVDRSDGT